MRVVLSFAAANDLRSLRDHLAPLSPKGLENVTAAIERRIQATLQYPESGRPLSHGDIREAVESRYGFLIPYVVRGDDLVVLRVYRSARTPLDYETLTGNPPKME